MTEEKPTLGQYIALVNQRADYLDRCIGTNEKIIQEFDKRLRKVETALARLIAVGTVLAVIWSTIGAKLLFVLMRESVK